MCAAATWTSINGFPVELLWEYPDISFSDLQPKTRKIGKGSAYFTSVSPKQLSALAFLTWSTIDDSVPGWTQIKQPLNQQHLLITKNICRYFRLRGWFRFICNWRLYATKNSGNEFIRHEMYPQNSHFPAFTLCRLTIKIPEHLNVQQQSCKKLKSCIIYHFFPFRINDWPKFLQPFYSVAPYPPSTTSAHS
jgi:hypothetical protein